MVTDTSAIMNYHFPRWQELPELDLYMDQIISIIDRYLSIFSPEDPEDKLMTPTMINNYVKQRMVSAPVSKKYDRPKVAFFLILALLKRVMSISELAELKRIVLEAYPAEEAYNLSCSELESAVHYVFGQETSAISPVPQGERNKEHSAVRAAAVAFANKFYLQQLLRQSPEEQQA